MDQFVVSARKYRPDTFDSVVGQNAITTTLKNAIRSGHIAQSFLFCGPRGVGKTTCARILAKTINCMNPTSDMEACGECESCKGFENNASQNIYELDAASNRSVESMRTLIEQVRIPPQIGKYKVYIIDEVHMLTTEAFNAFLKTLEEPPAYAKFILATTERNKILPTILSRCQISDFKRITSEDMVKHLQHIAGLEKIEADEEGLRIIAQKADGGLRDALSMFDQVVSFSGNKVPYSQVIALLNILDYDCYFRFTEYFIKGEHSNILTLFNEVLNNGFDAQNVVNGLNQHLRQLLLSRDPKTLPLLDLSLSLQERYSAQTLLCNPLHLLQSMDLCNRCDLDYRSSNNKRLLVEILLLNICALFGASEAFPKVVFQPTEVEGKPSKETTAKASSVNVSQKESLITEATASTQSSQLETIVSEPEKEDIPTIIRSTDNRTSLSIKALKKNIASAKDNASEENSANEKTSVLDFSQVSDCWNKFAEKIKLLQPSFYTVLKFALLNKTENQNEIEVTVGNALQSQILEENKQEIGNFLRAELKTQSLSILTKIDEQIIPEVKVYSAQEKYLRLVEQYPLLKELRDKLQLDIDI